VRFAIERKVFNVEEVTRFTVMEFLNSLQARMRSVTIGGYYRAIRAFFFFLAEEEYTARNPMKKLRAPKVEQKIMRTFSKQEIDMMLRHFDRDEFIGLRNYMVMCLLFSTGMRKGELLELKMKDINLTVDSIKIMGKGSKERIVPIGRAMRRVIIEYVQKREHYLAGTYCDYFLVSKDKRRLLMSGLNTMFANMKKELKLGGERFSPHTWRHTFAKTFLINGGDVFSLQKILGHSDISTTKKYINLNDRELKVQHAKFNPLDNKEWMI
jgi:site-specific recombinase XerD